MENKAEYISDKILSGIVKNEEDYCKIRRTKDKLGINVSALIDKLKDIDNISDDELRSILDTSYSLIMNKLLDNTVQENVALLQTLFNNKRFIIFFKDIVSRKHVSDYDRIMINKCIYDYRNQRKFTVDEDIATLLSDLADLLNVNELTRLLGFRLPKYLASSLANAAYSHQEKVICVKRVNLIIYNNGDAELFTEQMLVDTYVTLFGTEILKLVEGVVIDKYPEETLQAGTKDQVELYYRINLAVLDIVNFLKLEDIKSVLLHFKNIITFSIDRRNVRLDFNVSADYNRIIEAQNQLRYFNNVGI